MTGWTITEHETDAEASYVWAKVQGLRATSQPTWQTDWFKLLQEVYDAYLDQAGQARLVAQKKNKQLDRLDLAVLLRAIAGIDNSFQIERDYYSLVGKTRELKRKKGKFKADYKLMIIDEFQNYLPEHLAIFSQAINRTIGEMVYIGDFNQRVRLGTVNNLSGIGGELPEERIVKLSKVYRNTKEILTYLKQLGFDVVVPDLIKSGPRVEELILTLEAELEYVTEKLAELKEVSVGILSHNEELLKTYQQQFGEQSNVKVMSLIDSQGVEFDAVFLIGVDGDLLSVQNLPPELQAEVGQIKKDLLYIALTRAMNSLKILGRERLKLS